MNPSLFLISKIASIIVHVEEMLSPKGHDYDKIALEQLLKDPEVVAWLQDLRKQALIPEKR